MTKCDEDCSTSRFLITSQHHTKMNCKLHRTYELFVRITSCLLQLRISCSNYGLSCAMLTCDEEVRCKIEWATDKRDNVWWGGVMKIVLHHTSSHINIILKYFVVCTALSSYLLQWRIICSNYELFAPITNYFVWCWRAMRTCDVNLNGLWTSVVKI